ncbi:hypothetical protein HPP92_026947 [Vanilla planifolia]|uniref:Uncharacterized protein n=1 Tax=Vanilla planifolia TaxID=51239 RepID=A0A835PBN1_VANPL|nr:hypothetical protein HPP92_026947 [Vanilla planifolia]
MPTAEWYEEHQSKVKEEASSNDDVKDVTPCSGWRSPIEMKGTNLIEIPSSGCASFTVCILHDVQPSLVFTKLYLKIGYHKVPPMDNLSSIVTRS